VRTDTARGPTDALKFVLWGVTGSLGFFGLLRLNWTEAHLVLPLTRIQARLAVGLFGTPGSPVEATLACSGTDALALCLGAIVAYPVTWRSRLAGCCGGAALILGLNTLRIGTLGLVASSALFVDENPGCPETSDLSAVSQRPVRLMPGRAGRLRLCAFPP
jgi:hypothetical protein